MSKEKKKTLKKPNRHMRKLKKEQCKKHEDCEGCPYYEQTVIVTDTTMTCGYFCHFYERKGQ